MRYCSSIVKILFLCPFCRIKDLTAPESINIYQEHVFGSSKHKMATFEMPTIPFVTTTTSATAKTFVLATEKFCFINWIFKVTMIYM